MIKYLFLGLCVFSSLLAGAQCFDESNTHAFDYKGHSYKIVKENKKWEDAAACAVQQGGYLTEIGDLEEQNAIFAQAKDHAGISLSNTKNEFGTAALWIGGSDSQQEGTWIWDGDNDGAGTQFWDGGINGQPVNNSYSNWGTVPPEPDNSGNQDKLTLTIETFHPNFGKWNDLQSSNFNKLFYIIEYDNLLAVSGYSDIKSKIQIFPIPFHDILSVLNHSNVNILAIDIFDISGKNIFSKKTVLKDNKFDVSYLKRGFYLLKLSLDNGDILSYKIIK